jgi:hypothetical protein
MNNKKIVIMIDDKGEVQVEAFGHKGGSCTKATDPLTKALIGGVIEDRKKPEFYQNDVSIKVREFE